MAVLYPDILQHNNANLALVDVTSLRGNAYPIDVLSSTGSIPSDKRKVGMLVFTSGSQALYAFFGQTTSSADWDSTSNWKTISTGAANQIITGSISATVNTTSSELFLIKSGSTQYLNISSSGNTELYSNLFIIKNFATQQPVFTVSQSIVQFATQSADPTGTTTAGSIWFTSASFYVGLEDI